LSEEPHVAIQRRNRLKCFMVRLNAGLVFSIWLIAGPLAGAANAQIQPIVPGSPGTIPPPPPPAPLSGTPPPGAPPRLDTFQDKAARCVHHGSSFGVPPGQIGEYTRNCIHSQ
jgi:hypothetical protein